MHQQGLNPSVSGGWWPRLAAFVMAALAAGSVAFWILKFQASTAPDKTAVVAGATGQSVNPPDASALARALGADAASAVQAARPSTEPARVNVISRMTLQGVIASGSRAGTALIAIDGKPARAFRVGHLVDGELLLQAVNARQALLAPQLTGPVSATLELTPVKR